MSAYVGIFKMKFKSELQYRGKALSGVVTHIFWGVMYIFLYSAFMSTRGIAGFSIAQMISYIWLGQAFYVIKYIGINKSAAQEICNGNICYKFVRPMNLYDNWFAEYFGEKMCSNMLRCLPVLIISILLPYGYGLMMPVSFVSFVLFLVSLFVGLCISVAISMFTIFLTMKTLNHRGSNIIVTTMCGVLGGMYIPIPLMPQRIQNILVYLPFGYVSDLPLRIYIGNIGIENGLLKLAIAVVWLVVLVILVKLLFKSALKKVVVQGG